eukprot:scaffold33229_cov112-Isochrysis_galbana.AAC.2
MTRGCTGTGQGQVDCGCIGAGVGRRGVCRRRVGQGLNSGRRPFYGGNGLGLHLRDGVPATALAIAHLTPLLPERERDGGGSSRLRPSASSARTIQMAMASYGSPAAVTRLVRAAISRMRASTKTREWPSCAARKRSARGWMPSAEPCTISASASVSGALRLLLLARGLAATSGGGSAGSSWIGVFTASLTAYSARAGGASAPGQRLITMCGTSRTARRIAVGYHKAIGVFVSCTVGVAGPLGLGLVDLVIRAEILPFPLVLPVVLRLHLVVEARVTAQRAASADRLGMLGPGSPVRRTDRVTVGLEELVAGELPRLKDVPISPLALARSPSAPPPPMQFEPRPGRAARQQLVDLRLVEARMVGQRWRNACELVRWLVHPHTAAAAQKDGAGRRLGGRRRKTDYRHRGLRRGGDARFLGRGVGGRGRRRRPGGRLLAPDSKERALLTLTLHLCSTALRLLTLNLELPHLRPGRRSVRARTGAWPSAPPPCAQPRPFWPDATPRPLPRAADAPPASARARRPARQPLQPWRRRGLGAAPP